MKTYNYSLQEKKLIEESVVPLAVYQYINKRVVTIALSDGFREYLGLDTLEETYEIMNKDLFYFTHPDDVVEMTDAAVRFAVYDEPYDIVYRSKRGDNYVIAHATGKHIYKEGGERLAVVAYTIEGPYTSDNSELVMGFTLLQNKYFHNKFGSGKLNYDYLTGLPSLNYFFELVETFNEQEKGANKMSMLFMDFDGMKLYNQRYGYAEGDGLIKAMGKLLAHTFSTENCCRTTADHFIVYTTTDGLNNKLEKLIDEAKRLNEGRSLPVKIGVYDFKNESIGVATATDRAKIACDSCGKIFDSHISYFEMGMMKVLEERRRIYEHFDNALTDGSIEVYYQPIIRTSNGKVCAEEALVRWKDSNGEILYPLRFVPLLEEAKIAYKLDLFVLEKVIEKQKLYIAEGKYTVPDTINFSRSDFYSCDILEEVCKRVDEAGIGRNNIIIEITESILAEDTEYMINQLNRFKEAGFNVWLDDFGNSYSNPDILQQFQFDVVKIDKSFIDQIRVNKNSRIIVVELVKMITALGSEALAEGVETFDQVAFIQEIGCTRIQGFYYSDAITKETIFDRYKKGIQIGMENPKEAAYYSILSRINLYDFSGSFSSEDNEDDDDMILKDYFDTIPMAILEYSDDGMSMIRCNKSFKTYNDAHHPKIVAGELMSYEALKENYDLKLLEAFKECCSSGKRQVLDVRTINNGVAHVFLKRIASNPENGTVAFYFVILGYVDNDSELKHKEELERIKQERKTFERISALSGRFICIYSVNPDTDQYVQFVIDERFKPMELASYGEDFYEAAAENAHSTIYPDDMDYYLKEFTKEKILDDIYKKGVFCRNVRLRIDGQMIYVQIKATMIEEENGPQIIFGIINMNEQVAKEQEYTRELMAVKDSVNMDPLTGVKNKHAYIEVEKQIDKLIAENKAPEFAIVVCDINDLKRINDTMGHRAGDKHIVDGCNMICQQFTHSPVFRFGGDEFVVIVKGDDYKNIESIMEKIADINAENKNKGKVVVAAGMSRYRGESKMSKLFNKADGQMYENKNMLKWD